MFAFGVCLVSVSYTESYAVTLLLFCICTAAHGAYHSTVVMNPNDILPHHSGLAFGRIYLISPKTHQYQNQKYCQRAATYKTILDNRVYYTVVSHSHIMSHRVEMAYLKTCAKSYSILFK